MKKLVSSIIVVFLFIMAVYAYADKRPEAKDHPLISRYKGASIVGYERREFDAYRLVTGKVSATGYADVKVTVEEGLDLEGMVTRILYEAPKERSTLEIYRNYETQLDKAGFERLFVCSREECSGSLYEYFKIPWNSRGWLSEVFIRQPEDERYLAARLARESGDIYVSLYVGRHTLMNSLNRAWVHLDVVEVKPMAKEMVVIDAAALKREIEARGHVPIYGIFFDEGKDVVTAASRPALMEVAKLLKENTGLKLFIVGHTDSRGSIQYNMDLSSRRASAVKAELTGRHGIDTARLGAVGIGYFGPVATNGTEEGRARNRRVELIEWTGND